MKRSAYPKYKPSGIEWLGEVPGHWQPQEVKFCYSIQLGKMLQPEAIDEHDEELPYLKSQHVQWQHVRVTDLPTMWGNKRERLKYAVSDGDLLVCEGGDVGRAGIVWNAPERAIIQNALHRVRPLEKNDPRMLLYVLIHADSQGWFEILCNKATIAHFTGEKFGALGIALPPADEQRSIADYLDFQTAKIDSLVAKKRELIERLKEKRAALISRTVTRGLPPDAARAAGFDPNPKLKPSGIEWLGDVPTHWEVKQVFRVAPTIQTGPFGTQLHASDYVDDGIPLINPAHIVAGRLVPEQTSYVDETTVARLSRHQLRDGDIIMGRRGEIGRCAVVSPSEAGWLCGTGSLVIRLTESDSRYFVRVFGDSGFTKLLELHAVGSTMLNLNPTIVGRMQVSVPPRAEQTAIADYLDRETARLDAMTEKVQAAIERLQEYRIALITAAVTGKIDVRKDAA